MPDITLTTFVDYVSKSGTAKITCAKQAKRFYEDDTTAFAARSFYLGLKHAVTKCFEAGGDKLALEQCLADQPDAKKLKSYRANVAGLKQWMGRKSFEWIGATAKTWTANGLQVSVNPELAVLVGGQPQVIKLYFKADQLRKASIDPMLHLLETTHGTIGTVGVLDVQRSKLFVATRSVPSIDALLRAEAASLANLWNEL
jgi:hypothetical protein